MLPCLADRVLRMLLPASHREAEALRELPLRADRNRGRERNTVQRRILIEPLRRVAAAGAERGEGRFLSSMTTIACTVSLRDLGSMEICQSKVSLI